MKRIVSIILVLALIINVSPYMEIARASGNNINLPVSLSSNKESIFNGQKAVDYNISYLHLSHPNGYTLDSDRFDLANLHNVVKIIVNGVEESPIDSKGNSRYDINYSHSTNRLEIKIKEGESNQSHLKPFILKKHNHYNISIPKGFFINKQGQESERINYNFTTKGDGLYGNDILRDISPANGSTEIDYKNHRIILSFIDDIELNDDVGGKENQYFSISSKGMTNPTVGNFNDIVEENLNNYNIYIENNKLIFQKNTGKLDDFAKYTLTMARKAVVLKNSKNLININPIYNDFYRVNFDTDNWVKSSYPLNNQKDVEINPLIKIQFKYPVELVDRSKITLSSDGHIYSVDMEKDTWINYDGDTLKIDINSLYRSGENLLRANAAYKLTVGKGALEMRDYNVSGSNVKIKNDDIYLYFTTGNKTAGADEGLVITKYTSEVNFNHDNIINLPDLNSPEATKLDKDGNIYIHFNREIKWNQWTVSPKVKTNEDALKYFKLYKTPKAYKRDHNEEGIVYDEEFRYDSDKKSLPQGGLDEIPIESVEIVKDENGKSKVIKIKPKYDLINLNEYIIKLTKKDIITDDFEKTLMENINQSIYTKGIPGKTGPQWDMDKVTSEEIIENHKGPYKEGPYKETYTIHGAPNYNEDIDGKGKPIILYLDREVVLNPYDEDPLAGINLNEGYREDDTSSIKREIKWYKLENFYDGGMKKTKVSIYPEGELHSGRYYELSIDKGVFKSRANLPSKKIILNFVIEGDETIGRGIYKFKTEPFREIFLTSDFGSNKKDIEFDIIGYNFKEDIKQLRFVRVKDGRTIIIPKSDPDLNLKFHDVTKITGTIRGDAKAEFAKIEMDEECGLVTTNAGIYDIFLDFESGSSAGLTTASERFIVRDRPRIIKTIPADGERYFDSERLKKSFEDPNEEGYYLEVVFENIGGTLDLVNSLPNGIWMKIEGEDGNLVDENGNLRFTSIDDEFTLFIPLLDRPADGQIYNVFIPESTVVKYKDGREEEERNRCYKITFDTNYLPKADRLYEGSVPEFYDYRYPIVIDGSSFRRDTRVRFKATDGRIYNADAISLGNDNQRLYIYLPRNRRLPVGLYDIIISNGYNYDIEMVHGVLSVVEQGDYVPNEEYRVKDESSSGIVKETIKTSKDTLELKERNMDMKRLEIDLDELMGINTWVRSVKYTTSKGDYLEELILKSKWANVNIGNLKLHENTDEKQIELRVGRVEPSLSDGIKKQIVNNNIKSNFIEISGGNFDFDNISIEIPYFESDGSGLKMLRYDEENRTIEEIQFEKDLPSGKLIGYSQKPGIFVIVD